MQPSVYYVYTQFSFDVYERLMQMSLIDLPEPGERRVFTLYHDGVTVVYEKAGKHGSYVKLREDHYTYEQFIIALSLGRTQLPNVGKRPDGSGSVPTVSEAEQNVGLLPTPENTVPADGDRTQRSGTVVGRGGAIGTTGIAPTNATNPDDGKG